MVKTRRTHSFRPQVRRGPTPPAAGPSPAAAGSAAAGHAAAVGTGSSALVACPTAAPAAAAPAAGDAKGSSYVAPAQRRYHTQAGPTQLAPSHPRPAQRASPAKRA